MNIIAREGGFTHLNYQVVITNIPIELLFNIFQLIGERELQSISCSSKLLNKVVFESKKHNIFIRFSDLIYILTDSIKNFSQIHSENMLSLLQNQKILNCINLMEIKASVEMNRNQLLEILKNLKKEEFVILNDHLKSNGKLLDNKELNREIVEVIELGETYLLIEEFFNLSLEENNENKEREMKITTIIEGLMKGMDHKKALEFAEKLSDKEEKDFAFSLIVENLAIDASPEKLESLMDKISNPFKREATFQNVLGTLLNHTSGLQKAIQMGEKIAFSDAQTLDEKVRTLRVLEGISKKIIESDRVKDNWTFFQKAMSQMNAEMEKVKKQRESIEKAIEEMSQDSQETIALALEEETLTKWMSYLQEKMNDLNDPYLLEKTDRFMNELPHLVDEEEKNRKIVEMINQLIESFKVEKALEFIEKLSASVEKDRALSQIAERMVMEYEPEKLQALLNQIDDISVQDLTLENMVRSLLEQNEIEKAIAIADQISPSKQQKIQEQPIAQRLTKKVKKVWCLQKIVKTLLSSNRFPEATNLIRTTTDEMQEEITNAAQQEQLIKEAIGVIEGQSPNDALTSKKEQLLEELQVITRDKNVLIRWINTV